MSIERNRAGSFGFGIEFDQSVAESRDAQKRRAPIGYPGEVVDEPAERVLNLIERTRHHHEAAESEASAEEAGRRHENRYDDREPAIAGADPSEPREAVGEIAPDRDDAIDGRVHDAPLALLTGLDRDRVGRLVDMDDGEAKVRLTSITLGIELDEWPPDHPGQRGACEGVGKRAPDHIARNGETLSAIGEEHPAREHPQHADEAHEKERRLQKPTGERRRE